MFPDMSKYQSNRRRMAWAALAMMIITTTAVIWDPSRMAEADAVLMMMYGSLSALVGAYFGFANSSTTVQKNQTKTASEYEGNDTR